MKPIVAVLCPMDMEFRAVENVLGVWGETLEGGFEEKHFALNGLDLVLARCGVGKTFAAAKAQKIIMAYHPSHIIVCGVAGAVDPAVSLFDVVVPDHVVHGDVYLGGPLCKTGVTESAMPMFRGNPSFSETDGFLPDRLNAPSEFRRGTLATLDAFAEEEKKTELEKTCNAVCIDMESAAVAQIATLWDVPFTVIRAMSDTRTHSFGDFETNAAKACDVAAKALMVLLKNVNAD